MPNILLYAGASLAITLWCWRVYKLTSSFEKDPRMASISSLNRSIISARLQNSSFLFQNSLLLIQDSSFLIQDFSFSMQNSSFFLTDRAPAQACAPAIIREIYQSPACIYKADSIYLVVHVLCPSCPALSPRSSSRPPPSPAAMFTRNESKNKGKPRETNQKRERNRTSLCACSPTNFD